MLFLEQVLNVLDGALDGSWPPAEEHWVNRLKVEDAEEGGEGL